MTNFNPVYLSFAKTILKIHETQVKIWSEDHTNPDLANACLMLINAGKQAQEAEK